MLTKNMIETRYGIQLLGNLVKHEQSMDEVELDASVTVSIPDSKQIIISVAGIHYVGELNRPLIHKLATRIDPKLASYEEAKEFWYNKMNDVAALELSLNSKLQDCGLKLKVNATNKSRKTIYGLITDQFVEVNQLTFRHEFLSNCGQSGHINPQSQGFRRNYLGNLVEEFKFNSPGFQTGYKYGLVYARNTGYDSYKVDWSRWVLICKNGLMGWRATRSRWNHNHSVAIDDFLRETVQDGLDNQKFLEDQITAKRESQLDHDMVIDLYARLSLPQATKDRIQNQLSIEADKVGKNEWALSQALTYLGTHDRHTSFRSKRHMIDMGTSILERSLEEVIELPSVVGSDGFYDSLLPENLTTLTDAA